MPDFYGFYTGKTLDAYEWMGAAYMNIQVRMWESANGVAIISCIPGEKYEVFCSLQQIIG